MARPTTVDPLAAPRAVALNLLSRREHSAWELRHKLARRGFEPAQAETVLAELQDQGWQDDARFAEQYVSSRAERGFGPLRISSELRLRGVTDDTAEAALAELSDRWQAHLERLYHKRFGGQSSVSAAERARRQRFLRQRGFTSDQINRLFRPE